jgi:tetratricopeptide (TPR) repeat protein
VQEAIDAYLDLSKEVFKVDKVLLSNFPIGDDRSRFNHLDLENAIKKMIKQKLGPEAEDHAMSAPTTTPSCNVFVVATMPGVVDGPPKLFRSYSCNGYEASKCAIWKAARATTAAPTFFKAMTITDPAPAMTYVDGGLGYNNPSWLAREECDRISPGCMPFIISLGTGRQKSVTIPHEAEIEKDVEAQRKVFKYAKKVLPALRDKVPGWKTVANFPPGVISVLKMAGAIPGLVTNSESTHRTLYTAAYNHNFPYYRFNVEREVGDIGLGDHAKFPEMATLTARYLAEPETVLQKITCVQRLLAYHIDVGLSPCSGSSDIVEIDPELDVADPPPLSPESQMNLDMEIAELLEQIDSSPDDHKIHKRLADAYSKAGNNYKAIEGWSYLVGQHPEKWKLHTQLANVFRTQTTVNRTMQKFKTFQNRNQENRLRALETEIATWKTLVTEHPRVWGLQVQLAKAFAKKGDLEEEIDGWWELVDQNPKEWKLQSELAQAYAKKELQNRSAGLENGDAIESDMDQEISGWSELVDNHSDEWELQIRLAEAYAKKTRMEEAIRTWRGVLGTNRGQSKLAFRLATILSRKKGINKEISDWERLVQKHPQSRGLQMQLEMAYARKGNNDAAIDAAITGWKELVKKIPQQRELAIHLKRAWEKKEDKTENIIAEIEDWKELVGSHPGEWTLHTHLAEVYLQVNSIEEEIACWIELLNKNPEEQELRDRVLTSCLKCETLQEALKCLQGLTNRRNRIELPAVVTDMFQS